MIAPLMSIEALLAIEDRPLQRAEVTLLLADIDAWCAVAGVRENEFGRMACDFGGFIGLMRLRGSARTRMAALSRALIAAYPGGVVFGDREALRTAAFNMMYRVRVPDLTRRRRAVTTRQLHSAGVTVSHSGDRPRVSRDPCPSCGTRSDLGCAHQLPYSEVRS